ncbi:hypothetical protein [Actinomycetospora atypica]|uniref:XRE family transcriptional regulator n=1 Tax=Actinomycetospora atypica TaxID=1290095 RepID=A0ABV9YG09_9PSEU
MPDYRERRAGEPGRRPEPVARDGSPRRELAYWLRGAVEDHGGATLDRILRALPDEARLSRSALGKALRGDTFGDLALVLGVLRAVGADEAELEAWRSYWASLDDLESRRRRGEQVVAPEPPWAGAGPPGPDEPRPDEPTAAASGPPADPSVDPAGRPRRSWLLVGVGLLLGCALTLAALAFSRGVTSAAATEGPAGATIITPATTTVPRTFRVAGSSHDLPPGTLLWATTFDPGTGRFFPQDKPCVTRADGTFDCGQYYLGVQDAPDTATYRIDVFVADAGASNALLQYQIDKGGPDGPNPGIATLPTGTSTIFTRSYTRF